MKISLIGDQRVGKSTLACNLNETAVRMNLRGGRQPRIVTTPSTLDYFKENVGRMKNGEGFPHPTRSGEPVALDFTLVFESWFKSRFEKFGITPDELNFRFWDMPGSDVEGLPAWIKEASEKGASDFTVAIDMNEVYADMFNTDVPLFLVDVNDIWGDDRRANEIDFRYAQYMAAMYSYQQVRNRKFKVVGIILTKFDTVLDQFAVPSKNPNLKSWSKKLRAIIEENMPRTAVEMNNLQHNSARWFVAPSWVETETVAGSSDPTPRRGLHYSEEVLKDIIRLLVSL